VSLLHKDYAATGEAALTPPADSRAAGIFVFQELLTGIGGSSLQVGARGDAYRIVSHAAPKFGDGVERTFTALSGSAGVRVPLGAGSLAFTAARSFRAPTVEELFSGAAHAGTGAVEFGDPLLAAERGVSFEALGHVQSGRVSGQLAVHRNRIDNYIMLVFQRDTVLGGATLPVYRYAQAPATLYGAEASVEVAVGSRTAAEFRGDWLRAHQADGTPLSFMPAPRVGAGLRWDDGRWSAGADAEHAFAQRRVGVAGEVPTAAYTLLRVDAGARFRTGGQLHSIGIRVDNLLDVEYRDASSRIRDFAPAAGRNISVIYRGWFMP
jgi:iron complex outermembrane receptor protein